MTGVSQDLYFGALHVGVVARTRGRFPEMEGEFRFEPSLARTISGQKARLAHFVALRREQPGSDSSDAAAATRAEVPAEFHDFLESPEWSLVDADGCALPIQCPRFFGERRVAWRWHIASGYEVRQRGDRFCFLPCPDRGPGRAARRSIRLGLVLGLFFLVCYAITGLWFSDRQQQGNAPAQAALFMAWVLPAGFFAVLAGLTFAGMTRLYWTSRLPLDVDREGAIRHAGRLLAAPGNVRRLWLERASQWIQPQAGPGYTTRWAHLYLERSDNSFIELPSMYSRLDGWELGSILAYELAGRLGVEVSNGTPPPILAARQQTEHSRRGCHGLLTLAVGLPNFLVGTVILVLAHNQVAFVRWGVGGVFTLAGALVAALGWFHYLRGGWRGFVMLLSLLAALLFGLLRLLQGI